MTGSPQQPTTDRTRDPAARTGAIGFAVLMSLIWIVLGLDVLPTARSHDFLSFYTGASLALEGRFADLHDRIVTLDRQRQLVPSTQDFLPFVRPHFYAAVIAPFALLPFDLAFLFWLAMHASLLVACWFWGYRTFGPTALVLGSIYLPTALGVAHGQDGVLMLLAVIGAYQLARNQAQVWSGAVLGLALMKFHLLLLAPVAMVVQGRWRMLAGFVAVGLGLVSFSLVVAGRAGMQSYAELLLATDIETRSAPDLMINGSAVLLHLGIQHVWGSVTLALAVVFLLVMGIGQAPLWRFFAVWPVASLLFAPQAFGYDAALLMLPLWLVFFRSPDKLTRMLAVVFLTPAPFLGSLLGSLWAMIPAVVLLLLLGLLALRNRRVTPLGQAAR